MFWSSILVNIGMWLERFLIIVPGLARRTPFVFTWEAYSQVGLNGIYYFGHFVG